MLIKYSMYRFDRIGFILLVSLVVALCVLLFFQYRFFAQQTEKMILVRQEYEDHLVALEKIRQDYIRSKEYVAYIEAQETKKKNSILSDARPDKRFGVTDTSSASQEHTFTRINRDLTYLKQESLDYLKQHKLDHSLQQRHLDAWRDYTDQLVERQSVKKKRGVKRKSKRSDARFLQSNVMQHHEHYNDITLNWPIKRSEFWLSSHFGPRRKANGAVGFHYGIDMAAVRGTPLYSAASGTVVEARYAPGYGKTIVIEHTKKYRTRYAHLDRIAVRVGDEVEPSTMIGRVGATGNVRSKHGRSGGSHLHFEVYVYGKRVNPMCFFTS